MLKNTSPSVDKFLNGLHEDATTILSKASNEDISEKISKTLATSSNEMSNTDIEFIKGNSSVLSTLLGHIAMSTDKNSSENTIIMSRRIGAGTDSDPAVGKTGAGRQGTINVNMANGFNGFRDTTSTVLNSISAEGFARDYQDVFSKSFLDYNINAAQQDEYNREFWRLRMVEAGQNGVSYSIPKLTVFRQGRMKADGSGNFYDNMRNVWDAVQNPAILEGDYIDLVPVRPEAAGAVQNMFASYGIKDVNLFGVDVQTAPMIAKDGSEVASFNFLEICRSNIAGVVAGFEGIDTIAPGAELTGLFFKHVTVVGGGNPDVVRVFKLNTQGFPRTSYQATREGSSQEAKLEFRDAEIKVRLNTIMDLDTSVLFPTMGGNGLDKAEVVVSVKVASTINLENGVIDAPNMTSARILRLLLPQSDGSTLSYNSSTISTSTTAAQAAWATLTDLFTVDNYDAFEIKPRATNYSHREEGLIVHMVYRNYNMYVTPRSPLTIQSESSGTAQTKEPPIKEAYEIARIRRNNDGVTQMLGYAEYLRRSVGSIADFDANGSRNITAMGSDLVRPYYMEDRFDVVEAYTSVQSSTKHLDVAGALTTYLEIQALKAIRDSHYTGTLQQLHPGEKVRMIIGTDPLTANYIIRRGDSRVFGEKIEVEVVTTDVQAHYGKILMTMARANRADGDLLSSGELVVAPDFVASINPTSDGGGKSAHYASHRIQPAYTFVPVLPILVDITVENLVQAITLASVIKTKETV